MICDDKSSSSWSEDLAGLLAVSQKLLDAATAALATSPVQVVNRSVVQPNGIT